MGAISSYVCTYTRTVQYMLNVNLDASEKCLITCSVYVGAKYPRYVGLITRTSKQRLVYFIFSYLQPAT